VFKSIQSLCSGFSYCLSVLGTVYVWYGCGSTPRERQAALQYARRLEVSDTPPIELHESGKKDEMFWMILGDEEYANADYWKWRNTSSLIDPRIWRVNALTDKDVVCCILSSPYSGWLTLLSKAPSGGYLLRGKLFSYIRLYCRLCVGAIRDSRERRQKPQEGHRTCC
jgi:hypothetical protein